MLTVEGFQVPDIPSLDTVGNTGAVALRQIGATAVNVGVSLDDTVTVAVPLTVLGQPPPVMLTRFIVWLVVMLFNAIVALPPVSTAV